MKPHVYIYEDPNKQTIWYRGFVKEYTDSPKVFIHSCVVVRRSKFEAMKDAEELIKRLKVNYETRQNTNR
mgnify:CR=1 FL=1